MQCGVPILQSANAGVATEARTNRAEATIISRGMERMGLSSGVPFDCGVYRDDGAC